uniref:DM2 domain-containing protein n=1 Tax=Melopsittacus undulatus TaxID=13146 RepID=A0A8V5HGT3_MELUD
MWWHSPRNCLNSWGISEVAGWGGVRSYLKLGAVLYSIICYSELLGGVRPKLPLLKILQAAGAQGETFTLKEVMHYLGQYIMVRQLYDKRQQHMVYCGGDQLGELLGLESFSVKDPSPVYEMLKRNLTSAAVAGRFVTVWASIFNVVLM